MSLFLAEGEMERLTGYTRPSAQRGWLTRRGWKHEVDSNGKPVVLRSYASKMLGDDTPEAPVPLVIDYSAIQ